MSICSVKKLKVVVLMHLSKRQVNGTYYWYIEESVRKGSKVQKKNIMSLGNTENALEYLKGKKEYTSYLNKLRDFIKTKTSDDKINLYFVYTGKSTVELEVVKKLKPQRLLISYYYFKTKSLESFIDFIGYIPEIILDSGAFSAFTKGGSVSLLDYLKYIEENGKYIKYYISLDVIGDSLTTYAYYQIMKNKGFTPLPVYHYGEDISYLKKYIDAREAYIALGGTVPIVDKNVVASWANQIIKQYPEVKFHLLGSSSNKIINQCKIFSCDSSTWIMGAVNGKVKEIPGNTRADKIRRAEFLMQKMIL